MFPALAAAFATVYCFARSACAIAFAGADGARSADTRAIVGADFDQQGV